MKVTTGIKLSGFEKPTDSGVARWAPQSSSSKFDPTRLPGMLPLEGRAARAEYSTGLASSTPESTSSISSWFDTAMKRGLGPLSYQRAPLPLAPKLHKKVALITLVLCTTCTIPNCQPISVLLKVSFLTSGPFLDLSVPLSHKDHSWDPQYVNCGQRGTPRLSSFTWVTLLSAWSTCPVLENCLTKRHHPPPRHWLVHDATKVPVGLAVRLT
mmetsp:Transcript_46841/g.124418  ORF Transcript_46841/g.124418 Transcript_46841/m.124418 type:complete len:212 (+) Transcript_46841:934-1569(+)